MPIFKQSIVDETDVQGNNRYAEPDWKRFKLVLLHALPKFRDTWLRVEPDFLNYQVVGWALAITERFELTMHGKKHEDYLLTALDNPNEGWHITKYGVVSRFSMDVLTPIRNPAMGLWDYERTQSAAAWKAANEADDFKEWMALNDKEAQYIKFPFSLQEKHLANPIILAVELICMDPSCGVYAPVSKVSPRMEAYVVETIRKAYRHQLNFIDTASWL